MSGSLILVLTKHISIKIDPKLNHNTVPCWLQVVKSGFDVRVEHGTTYQTTVSKDGFVYKVATEVNILSDLPNDLARFYTDDCLFGYVNFKTVEQALLQE